MRALLLASVFSMTAVMGSLPARAADVTAPVKNIIDATVKNWAEGENDYQDIFDQARLTGVYSKDFAEKFRAAAKFPAFDDGTTPFDYDVITGGQDGCPLQDVKIETRGPKGNATEVDASFKNMVCFGTDAQYQQAATVQFLVIEEGGKPVIDDIMTQGGDDAGFVSLKSALIEIAKQGG